MNTAQQSRNNALKLFYKQHSKINVIDRIRTKSAYFRLYLSFKQLNNK